MSCSISGPIDPEGVHKEKFKRKRAWFRKKSHREHKRLLRDSIPEA